MAVPLSKWETKHTAYGGNRDPEPGSSIPRSYGVQLDSTEIIELDQRSPTWTEGMQEKSK